MASKMVTVDGVEYSIRFQLYGKRVQCFLTLANPPYIHDGGYGIGSSENEALEEAKLDLPCKLS